jgi:hypothetical protein
LSLVAFSASVCSFEADDAVHGYSVSLLFPSPLSVLTSK